MLPGGWTMRCTMRGSPTTRLSGCSNRDGLYWTAQQVRERLRERMVGEAEHLWDFATEREIPLRTAAYAQALTRIGEAADAKGHKELYTDG